MSLFQRAFDEITGDDIWDLVAKQAAESSELEFKELPTPISDSFRNKVAEAIVAFAAADGGIILLGVAENVDASRPNRAGEIKAVGDCEAVADRLRQSLLDTIEPPLRTLRIRGIETEADGAGVVGIHVPRTRRALHRVRSTLVSAVRSGVENRRLDMREINAMILSFAEEPNRIERMFERLRVRAVVRASAYLELPASGPAVGFRVAAVPMDLLELEPVAGRADLQPVEVVASFRGYGGEVRRADAWRVPRSRVPTVRGETRTFQDGHKFVEDEVFADGSVVATLVRGYDSVGLADRDREMHLYLAWVVSTLVAALTTVDLVRCAAGFPEAQYALEPEILANGPVLLAFGDRDAYNGIGGYEVDRNTLRLPRRPLSLYADFPGVIALIMRDVLHSAGCDLSISWDVELPTSGAVRSRS